MIWASDINSNTSDCFFQTFYYLLVESSEHSMRKSVIRALLEKAAAVD